MKSLFLNLMMESVLDIKSSIRKRMNQSKMTIIQMHN